MDFLSDYEPSTVFDNDAEEPFIFANLNINDSPAPIEASPPPAEPASIGMAHTALLTLWQKAEGLRHTFEAAAGTVDPKNYQWAAAELASLVAWFNGCHRTQEQCLRVAAYFNPLCTLRELAAWVVEHQLGTTSSWWKSAGTPDKERVNSLRGVFSRHINQETGPSTSRTERDNDKRKYVLRNGMNKKQCLYRQESDLSKYQGHTPNKLHSKGMRPVLIELTSAGHLAIREFFGAADTAAVLSELEPRNAGLTLTFLVAFIRQHGAQTYDEIRHYCTATGNCRTPSGFNNPSIFARLLGVSLSRLSAEDKQGLPKHNKIFHAKAELVCRGGYYLLRGREFESWATRWLPGELATTHTLDRAGFNTAMLLRQDTLPKSLRALIPLAADANIAASQETQLLELVWQHLSTQGAASLTTLQALFSLQASHSAMPPFFCQLDLAARDALLERVVFSGIATGHLASRGYSFNAMAPELLEHWYFAAWPGFEHDVHELDWYLNQWELSHVLPESRAQGITVARNLFCEAWLSGQSLDVDYTLPVLPPTFFERRSSHIASAGLGLFTTTTVEMCSLLGPYTGVERPDLSADAWLPYGIRRADGVEIDGDIMPMSLPAMVNHAPADLATVWNKQLGSEIYFCFKRRVQAGEEVYFDYGPEWLNAAAAAGLVVEAPVDNEPSVREDSAPKRQRRAEQTAVGRVPESLNWSASLEPLGLNCLNMEVDFSMPDGMAADPFNMGLF